MPTPELQMEWPTTPGSDAVRNQTSARSTTSPASARSARSVRSGKSARSARSAKSKSTCLLRHQDSEWWVVRPDRGRDVTNETHGKSFCCSSDEEEAGDSDDDRSMTDIGTCLEITNTFCGTTPTLETGPLTGAWRRGVFAPVRRRCAGKRNRFEQDGFDLDLTYITSRVVAMSFAAVGFEGTYRNPRSEVVRFLEQRHKSAYRIYNLCEEKSHSDNGFPADVTIRYPCADHCPPTLPMLADFCRDVENWLWKSEENIAVVHCKAGKGRTGTMICALLVYAGAFPSAYDALVWFEGRRGGERSGVTIPHQIRWIAMLERWLRHKDEGLCSNPMGAADPHRLRGVRFGPIRGSFWGSETPGTSARRQLVVSVGLASRADVQHGRVTFQYPDTTVDINPGGVVEVKLPADGPIWCEKDGLIIVKIAMSVPGAFGFNRARKKKLDLWWHHSFLQKRRLDLGEGRGVEVLAVDVPKAWVGGLHKDMDKHKKAPADFSFCATFDSVVRVPIGDESAASGVPPPRKQHGARWRLPFGPCARSVSPTPSEKHQG